MEDTTEFQDVFQRLSKIMCQYERYLVCTENEKETYTLYTTHIMKNKKPLYFGSVTINKAYVSYHLMPVYVFPDLLKTLSPKLKKRMQGKSCFNFKTFDKDLFNELAQLTANGFARYRESGFVTAA